MPTRPQPTSSSTKLPASTSVSMLNTNRFRYAMKRLNCGSPAM